MVGPDYLRYTKIPLNNGSGAIPALGFGTLIPDPITTKHATKAALEAGFRQLDTAERYRTEKEVGEAMREVFEAGTIKRQDVFIATKLWNNNHRPERVAPAFDAAITLRRSSAIYMLKNLLPLFLLVLVVFSTLFFPETMFRERVTIPVTSILASAVLLVAVNSQIGDVGYTVVVEEMFYIFFVLCLMTILAGYRHEKLRDAGRKRVAVVLDHVAQVIYAGTVLAVIVVLYRRYAV
jgi:hypothetical protein